MQFFYMIIAITLSVGFGLMQAQNSRMEIQEAADRTRAEVAQQSRDFTMRSLRRRMQVNPGAGVSLGEGQRRQTLPQDRIENAQFGGYRSVSSVTHTMNGAGRIISTISDASQGQRNRSAGNVPDDIDGDFVAIDGIRRFGGRESSGGDDLVLERLAD